MVDACIVALWGSDGEISLSLHDPSSLVDAIGVDGTVSVHVLITVTGPDRIA